MGVNNCERRKCKSVMSDLYIIDVGYICKSCIDEFRTELLDKGISSYCRSGYYNLLKDFVKTKKRNLEDDEPLLLDDFINEL